MNDVMQNKILIIMNQLLQAANSITEELIKKTPEALNLVLDVARITALQNIVEGTVGFICMFLIVFCFYKYYVKVLCNKKNYDSYDNLKIPFVFITIFGGVLFFVIFSFSLITFLQYDLNIFNWIGIFNPNVYITHQFLVKIIN